MKKWIVGSMLIGSLCFAGTVNAQDMKLEIKAGTTMKDVLTDNIGKRVALRFASGEEIEGTVTTVGNSLVHISRLAGKDFYDAVVSVDKISAVRIRMRDK